ncbi:TlpA family protein disulfide reductase [Cellulomonas humilata]|uniref:TlpA family protein disulfide reductase n=1 Tax=Cellulomonas humilata TaxID=144055 RepID=A0A7Y5ZZJ1_9CELL|nr:TlpA disulfide reductase family protein [Cellulomonas humilata]NUU17009.1 TlpA family protein disulfide reductase [Cellulomonas humilata]
MSTHPDRPTAATSRRRATTRAAAVAALLIALAGGCAAETTKTSGQPADVADQGYLSGDGTTQTWPVTDRGEAVTLVGTDYEGQAIDTSAWLGDVIVLNTWYAACPPCRKEAPDLVSLANDYEDQGVRVLGINRTDAKGTAQAFQREFSVPYPSIDDTDGTAIAELATVVPVQAVPTTVVLDRQGRVAARIVGLAEGSTLRTIVEDVIADAQIGPTPTSS